MTQRDNASHVPAYVCFASDADSGFTTGEILAVTGGPTDTR